MDIAEPASVVLPASNRAVLRVLAGTTQPLTGRDVARLSSVSQSGAQKVLARLADHGLVRAEPAGRAVLYTLNRQHLLVEPLLEMLAARHELIARLVVAVTEWRVPAVHASLFGSVARGGGGPRSDVDVLVVRPDHVDIDDVRWREQLEQLTAAVHTWTGNRLSWLELSRSEVEGASANGEAIVTEWQHDAVPLAGVPLEELLAGARR